MADPPRQRANSTASSFKRAIQNSDRAIPLLAATKPAFELAQDLGSQAKLASTNITNLYQQIQQLYPRISFVSRQLTDQLHLHNWLMNQSLERQKLLNQTVSQLQTNISHVIEHLEVIFKLLKKKSVEPVLVNEEQEVNLYSFVDVASINKLKSDTFDNLERARSIATSFDRVVEKFAQQRTQLPTPSPPCVDNIESITQRFNEHTKLSTEMVAEMVGLAALYEKIVLAVKNGDQVTPEALTEMEEKSQSNEAAVEKLSNGMTLLEQIQIEFTSLVTKLENQQTEQEVQFIAYDTFAQELRSQLFAFKETQFVEAKNALTGFHEEFQNLIRWYELCYESYDYLIVELHRRRGYNTILSTFVDECNARFQQLVKEEQSEREEFYTAHGQYLPASLFSGIQDPPITFQCVPTDQDTVEFPDLSQSVVEEAMHNIGVNEDLRK